MNKLVQSNKKCLMFNILNFSSSFFLAKLHLGCLPFKKKFMRDFILYFGNVLTTKDKRQVT